MVAKKESKAAYTKRVDKERLKSARDEVERLKHELAVQVEATKGAREMIHTYSERVDDHRVRIHVLEAEIATFRQRLLDGEEARENAEKEANDYRKRHHAYLADIKRLEAREKCLEVHAKDLRRWLRGAWSVNDALRTELALSHPSPGGGEMRSCVREGTIEASRNIVGDVSDD